MLINVSLYLTPDVLGYGTRVNQIKDLNMRTLCQLDAISRVVLIGHDHLNKYMRSDYISDTCTIWYQGEGGAAYSERLTDTSLLLLLLFFGIIIWKALVGCVI